MREQQHCGDEVVDRERRLVTRDKGRDLDERNPCIGDGDRKKQGRDADDGKGQVPVALARRERGQEDVAVAQRLRFHGYPHARDPDRALVLRFHDSFFDAFTRTAPLFDGYRFA